ncbi:MAG TPA: hypothetical protein VJN93_17725 [Candidatus Acidoferrum sp.]|nr:hypothetical protein [Candidatus Acidoferrum sp.]
MSEAKRDPAPLVRECRERLEAIKSQKHQHFDELNNLVERITRQFEDFLPNYRVTAKGSKVVHHFGAPGTQPVSLEKEHGSRSHLPSRYATFAIVGIEMLLDYLEGLSR